jgi:recombinational DNA repair protein RecR
MHKNYVKAKQAFTVSSREEKIAVLASALDNINKEMKNCQHCQKNGGCHGHKNLRDKLTNDLEEIK